MFDPHLVNYLNRVKVVINGTKHANYLDGVYDGKVGRVLNAQRNPNAFDQSVKVKFVDNGEERIILARYVIPLKPTYTGEEVLMLEGKQIGVPLVVREKDDERVVVSSKTNPHQVVEVPMKSVAAMFDESG